MKIIKRSMAALLGFYLLLCSLIPADAKDYSKTKYDKTRWNEIKEDYLNTKTDRLVFVRHKGGAIADVEMWKKTVTIEKPFSDLTAADESTNQQKETKITTEWKKIVSCSAYIGANGLGKKKEGDRKTPIGIFNITMAFGRKKSPETAGISYTKLNQYHYWSSEKDTYNQFVDIRTLHRRQLIGEHLIDYNPQYNYALVLDYNRECTYPKGSAIFLHCIGSRTYTLGCIAVPEKVMKKIVQNTTRHTKICIYKN